MTAPAIPAAHSPGPSADPSAGPSTWPAAAWAAAFADGRIPIVLAVTGHRSVDPGNHALVAATAAACKALRARFPSSPFLILSGLAEGADRLVARVAMDTLDARLIAILPMPRADFAEDFPDPASRAAFDALLARAESVVALDPPAGDAWRVQGAARDQLYARVGAVLAEHAQILFALWDGAPARGVGGTGDVVEWFLRGYAPTACSYYAGTLSPLDPPEPGLLVHVDPATARVSERASTKGRGTPSSIETILAKTDEFNGFVRAHRPAIAGGRPLLPEQLSADAGARARADALAAAVPGPAAAYVAADTISVRFARIVRTVDALLYASAFGVFFVYNYLEAWPAFSFLYVAVTAAMAGSVWCVRRRRYDTLFLEYRALAEAMRVLFFWRIAGVAQPAWLCYLAKHSGVVHWVRHAVRTTQFRHDAAAPALPGIAPPDGLAVARRDWVEAQIDYYRAALDRHGARHRRWKAIALAAFAVSFVVAIALCVVAATRADGWFTWDASAIAGIPVAAFAWWMQLCLGVTAALGVAARGYMMRRADIELQKQYATALQIFDTARAELGPDDDSGRHWQPRETLERLGREALVEHGEWLWLRHSRPFEVPK